MTQLINKVILGDTSTHGPALASHQGRLFLAWKGSGNDNLNIMFSTDGLCFGGKVTFGDSSDRAPSLAAGSPGLFLGWKGSGNENLNVATVQFVANTAGAFGIEQGLTDKGTLGETSSDGPALAVNAGERMLSWKGAGNDNLNLRLVGPQGPPHQGLDKATFGDSSDHSPALTSHYGELFLAWKGSGNENLNVARAAIERGSISRQLLGKAILADTSTQGPSLASHGDRLALAWKGAGNDNLNIMFSIDNAASFTGKATFPDTSDRTPALASHNGRLFIAWKGSGNDNLNIAEIIQ